MISTKGTWSNNFFEEVESDNLFDEAESDERNRRKADGRAKEKSQIKNNNNNNWCGMVFGDKILGKVERKVE